MKLPHHAQFSLTLDAMHFISLAVSLIKALQLCLHVNEVKPKWQLAMGTCILHSHMRW